VGFVRDGGEKTRHKDERRGKGSLLAERPLIFLGERAGDLLGHFCRGMRNGECAFPVFELARRGLAVSVRHQADAGESGDEVDSAKSVALRRRSAE
jgi:hypothetical protein